MVTAAHLVSLGAVALAACAAAGDPPAAADPEPRRAPTGEAGPVIAELFTSQGCSSCPPADRILSELVREPDVVPLAFHVDYWNDLGWADPFSQAAWSERQRVYAAGADRIYTPQVLVGGATDVLGSNARAVRAAIAGAPRPSLLDATIEWSAERAAITATAPAGADVWVAVYEDALTTRVVRGENAGASLRNDHVVRALARVATAGRPGRVEVALDPSWKQVGAVAFAQARGRAITASRALAPRP